MPFKDPEKQKEWARKYYLEVRRKYYLTHKEEFRVAARKYDSTHREKRAEYARQARKRRPEHVRQLGRDSYKRKWHWFILKRFGLSLEQYEALVAKQNGVCAICKQACSLYSRLSVDHDHVTKRVRGLLCNSCNIGIGKFSDDIARLQSAIDYLRGATCQ